MKRRLRLAQCHGYFDQGFRKILSVERQQIRSRAVEVLLELVVKVEDREELVAQLGLQLTLEDFFLGSHQFQLASTGRSLPCS